jgi:hypothetical protein
MSDRPAVGRGLFYTRDSMGRSEFAPPQYVAWARGRARDLGVAFDGDAGSMERMMGQGLSELGDLFLDYGVSGNQLSRRGFDAFRRRALDDKAVSHLFVPRRDRIARPDNPLDAVEIELELRAAVLTLVLMDGIKGPVKRGQRFDLAELLTSLIDYDKSSLFRRELAEKLIHAKIKLAAGGFSIGGEPPYGFRRWLVGPDGSRKRQLERGEVVKMAGHHVVWLPTAEEELAVVGRILGLIESTPAARIARMLNDEGVPSPQAGRARRGGGVARPASGLWTQNTVKGIATSPLMAACWEYGRRASGDQLRLTADGPRPLGDDDYRPDGRPKVVANPPGAVIRTPAGFEPIIPAERRAAILQTLEGRGQHLKGKARTRRGSPNPLGGRIYDLSCGWLMYRHARRGRWGYQCGLYQNSQAKSCSHNVVDGETAAAFVLACLRQRALAPSAMEKLKARLGELAAREAVEDPAARQLEADWARLAKLERQLEVVGRNMALSETAEERRATSRVFAELGAEAGDLRARIEACRPVGGARPAHREVESALAVLDRLSELARSEPGQAGVTELFRRVDARLYLRFHKATRGGRKVREVAGGVLSFGATPPPSPLYDGPTDRAIIHQKLASGEPVSAVAAHVVPESVSSDPDVNWSANVQRGTTPRHDRPRDRHESRPPQRPDAFAPTSTQRGSETTVR